MNLPPIVHAADRYPGPYDIALFFLGPPSLGCRSIPPDNRWDLPTWLWLFGIDARGLRQSAMPAATSTAPGRNAT